MSTPRVAQGQGIAAQLVLAGVTATIDPVEAQASRPCVLVAPPVIDWTAGSMGGDPTLGWRLVALSSHPIGTLPAWLELDELVEAVNAVAHVETAEPIGYTLTPETGAVPAYAIRITT